MKAVYKYLSVLTVVFLLAGLGVQAQSKEEKEEKSRKLKELEMELKQEQMQKQKDLEKALRETKVMEAEELRAIIEDQKLIQEEALKSYRRSLEEYEDQKGKSWSFSVPEMRFDAKGITSPRTLHNYIAFGSGESTTLNIHKDVEDITFESKFKYEVQEDSRSFHFSASGSVDYGTILIRLLNPDEKVVHEFEVSPLADVEWSQNMKWDEEEFRSYVGTWTIVVAADEASGSYQVTVRAN